MATLLHCTDFHGNAAWFAWLKSIAPQFDAVVLSGDLVDEFHPHARVAAQATKATAFLRSFARPIFVVSGNHDGLVDLHAIARDNPFVRVDGFDGEHLGWRWVCVGWRGAPATLSAPAQDGPVVLVSHQPPDELAVAQDRRGDWGSYDVRALAVTLPAGSVVLSGHVHSPRNWNARIGRATAFNPGVAPADSKVPRHIVLDLAKRRARLVGGPAQDGKEAVAEPVRRPPRERGLPGKLLASVPARFGPPPTILGSRLTTRRTRRRSPPPRRSGPAGRTGGEVVVGASPKPSAPRTTDVRTHLLNCHPCLRRNAPNLAANPAAGLSASPDGLPFRRLALGVGMGGQWRDNSRCGCDSGGPLRRASPAHRWCGF